MRKANKAEEKRNTQYSKRGGGGGRGGRKGLGSGYHQDFPPLKPSVERDGEIKFHAANEQRMREMGDQFTSSNPKIIDAKDTTRKENEESEDKEDGGGVPVLDQKTAARLKIMDEDEDDYFCF